MTTEPSPAASLPSGLRWRLTSRFTAASRQRRLDLFMSEMRPSADDRILDVGVTDSGWRSSNFLEAAYPWPGQITAVGLHPMPTFTNLFPKVNFVQADGRALPFEDDSFDIGFSNAVVEHVGDREDQRRFVGELVRTCRRAFVATPNGSFPIDPHTLFPFVHWLPRPVRHRILRLIGQGQWASEAALNPLNERQLRALFPPGVRLRMVPQRTLGLTTVLIAVAERPGDRAEGRAESPG